MDRQPKRISVLFVVCTALGLIAGVHSGAQSLSEILTMGSIGGFLGIVIGSFLK